nr:Ig-like domain-containing protein [Vibrio crassostreae]
MSDGTNTVQASADLTVNPVNDLPVPQDQQFSVEEDDLFSLMLTY